MKAGRELDALIEEHVFERKVIKLTNSGEHGDWFEGDVWLGPRETDYFIFHESGDYPLMPARSTQIGPAWGVVELLKDNRQTENGVDVEELGPEIYWDIDKGEWSVNLVSPAGKCGAAKEPTIELAICLAALRAYGVEVKE